jgi:glycosyltransferase involved in cell wall biosynthesis
VDAHLVTHVRNLEAIERAGLVERRDFTAIDSERIAGPLWNTSEAIRKRLGLGATFTTGFKVGAYYYYEHLVMKQLEARLRAHEFDLVHRLTPLSPVIPSPLAKHCRRLGIPFIWGPINGGVPWPPGFGEVQRREGELLSAIRGLHRLLPGYRSTRENAAATLVGSRITMSQVPDYARDRAVYLPENAIDPERFSDRIARPITAPLRAAFVGRLVPLKGVDMLLEAAAPLLRNGALVLDIIGDGPERPHLEAMVETGGTAEAVTFAGLVPHEELSVRLAQSDLFAFPSIREFGGGAVLEAMALGLLPIVVDYAGPSELVTDDTGVRIPLGSRSEIVSTLREELSALVADPHVIREIGERARKRVLSLFTWDAKAAQTLEVYRWVLGERDKPDFGMPLR